MTDANLVLGRLIPDYFPKIFGKSEKEPLDVEASRRALEELKETINTESGVVKDLDEVVFGYVRVGKYFIDRLFSQCFRFIRVANETMCRPIRALTESRGYATSKHMYVHQQHSIPCSCPKQFAHQFSAIWRGGWSTRMRNCQITRHKYNLNPST